MSQQQQTESQLPINHEMMIEAETKFTNVITANISKKKKFASQDAQYPVE